MQKADIYRYYCFGYNYYILRRGMKGSSVHGEAEVSCNELLEMLNSLDLRVTRQAAEGLVTIREEMAALASDAVVDEQLAARISTACDEFDKTLDAELQLRNAYLVTPKRFPVESLLENAAALLSTDAPAQMPRICKFDFGSGCRAIAFSLPTAGAFHLLRCAEGMLRHYYETVVQRNRIKTRLWKAMIDHLRTRRKPPPKALLDHLDHIRENFRNPTQHPDARYDIDEAQDLLAVVIDAINRMARDMKSRAKAVPAAGGAAPQDAP
jgi:hypothetical protein